MRGGINVQDPSWPAERAGHRQTRNPHREVASPESLSVFEPMTWGPDVGLGRSIFWRVDAQH